MKNASSFLVKLYHSESGRKSQEAFSRFFNAFFSCTAAKKPGAPDGAPGKKIA